MAAMTEHMRFPHGTTPVAVARKLRLPHSALPNAVLEVTASATSDAVVCCVRCLRTLYPGQVGTVDYRLLGAAQGELHAFAAGTPGSATHSAQAMRVNDAVSLAMKCCAACGAANATLRCGGCRAVRFCGSACQKAHWRAGHRHGCVRA